MVEEPIAYRRLMDIAWLRIADPEVRVGAMSVFALCEFFVELDDMLHEPILVCLNVFFAFLAAKKLPCVEQIVDGDDMVVGMSEHTSHSFESAPRTISQEHLVPVVIKLKDAYLAWQQALPHVAKAKRQTIADRIDRTLLDTLEHAFRAGYASGQKKLDALNASSAAPFPRSGSTPIPLGPHLLTT